MTPYGRRPPIRSTPHGGACGTCCPPDVEPARARREGREAAQEDSPWPALGEWMVGGPWPLASPEPPPGEPAKKQRTGKKP